MNITVVGAGNMGLSMTAYMAIHKKGKITLFTHKNILDKGPLKMNDIENNEYSSSADFIVTADPEKAFCNADVVFITYPAFLRKKFVADYGQYFHKDSYIGFVPGYGGVEYSCSALLNRGVNIFGFQRVPYVARACEDDEGKTASILSRKKSLYIGAIPSSKTAEISKIVEVLLDIPVQSLKEYLSITLAPSNPLLHITGLYGVFKDYEPGQIYERPMKFYEEWNDDTSRLLFAYDAELQKICEALNPLDMGEVVPLPTYYESPTPERMTQKLKSIEAFKVVLVPLKKIETGYIPDLESRMFAEDYPFGVCVIKDFAMMTGVETPTVDLLLDFYERLSGHKYFEKDGTYTNEIKDTGVPGIHGIRTKAEIIRFYHR